MNCKEAEANLSLYLLGDISGQKLDDVKAHLEACPACRGQLAALEKTLEALEKVPLVPADPARVRRVTAAAASEGLLAARPIHRRAGVLVAAAAALALAAVLAVTAALPGKRTEVHGPGPEGDLPTTVGKIPPVATVRKVTGDAKLLEISRPQQGRTYTLREEAQLWIDDEIAVNDPAATVIIQFHTDAALLTVEGRAAFRLQGRKLEDYGLFVDHGTLRVHFTQPYEHIRKRSAAFVVETPVGLLEYHKGKDFTVQQAKTTLFKNTWMTGRAGFSANIKDMDLQAFVTRHLQTAYRNQVRFQPKDLAGKTVSLLCNRCPRDLFVDLLDANLAPQGIRVRRDGSGIAIEPGKASQPAPGLVRDFAYGELLVGLPTGGSAKVSGKDTRFPAALVLSGGEEGRIRPGMAGGRKFLVGHQPPAAVVKRLSLKSTFVSERKHQAEVVVAADGRQARTRVVSTGDEVNGYKVSWIWWDRVLLEKGGEEYVLALGK